MTNIRLSLSLIFVLFAPGLLIGQTILDNWSVHQKMEEESIFAGLIWKSLGPSFMGSRVETIEIPENNSGTIYVGFGSGSLWVTKDQGLSWNNIFQNQASFSIGDLAISSQNPDVLWLGTGEQLRASRGYCYPGSGIYKSTDGGETWINKGLTDSHHIGRVVIDPVDSNRVFVAVMGHFWSANKQRGLFYTDNGGDTWQHILYISDSVGISDLVWDPNNEILYASSWQIPDGPGSKVYKSVDLGKNWSILNLPLEGGGKTGRIGLTMSHSWPETIYATVDNRNPRSDTDKMQIGAEIYRSNDFGEHWKKTHPDRLDNNGGFGWAFGDIVVHPAKPDEIFILGIHLMRSTDGGKTFNKISGNISHLKANKSTSLHLDQHDLKIIPGVQDLWILGNDGGLFTSINQGQSWIHLNTIPTGEFYDISVRDDIPVQIYGGTQDNSNITGIINPFDFDGSGNSWDYVWLDPWSGGDGFTSIPDPTDFEIVYWESQNGYINRKNITTGVNTLIKPRADKDEKALRNSWFTPYFISVHNNNTLYYAANKVYKSIDKGHTWFRVSHDLTFAESKSKTSRSITVIAESPVQSGIIYAGTEKGAVWISRNDGTKWFEVSDGIPDKKVVCIFPSKHVSSRVYLVAKGMNDDDQSPYIYTSDNYGRKWKMIMSDLPKIPVNCITEDPLLQNLLFVGTDAGVFCTQNRGVSWQSISYKLPTACIQQLRWMSNSQFLLGASHGQGLFYCHIQPLRLFSQSGHPEEHQFLGSIPGRLPASKDYKNDWDLSSGQSMVLSWFTPESGTTSISFADSMNIDFFSIKIESIKGLNQYVWDLITGITPDKTNYPLPEITFPKAGSYKVSLNIGPQIILGEVQIKENQITKRVR
ncbi:MAG: hypothetical protein U9N86_10545 [Bacteroidota bacterium]|nr:hypothetical protein [Bacteroidota bacterium]